MSQLFIIGAGGHGCVLAELASKFVGDLRADWTTVILLDDQRNRPALEIGIAVSGKSSELKTSVGTGDSFLIGLGNNRRRMQLLHTMRSSCAPATLVAPDAHVSPSCTIGPGTVVMPGAIVQTGATIGEGCILNSGCVIEHGVTLESGVHVAPGACIGGDVTIGECSLIGIGASVLNGNSISPDVVVGGGGVVTQSLHEPGTYVGVPTRPLQ
ncbi:MAG: hypothetical protein CBC35_00645 [Planctomycetes bacterium TMED75]|nr:hypothetical protein [Planctomycetaceae bacterium]OUU96770.1 MAG: hypothetical protein CBC35_00645 [Planctomycetes bacterium TMED75]